MRSFSFASYKEVIKLSTTYIGLDIALNKTGLVLVRDNTVLDTKIIELKSGWKYYRKLVHLYEWYSGYFSNFTNPKLILEGRLKAGFSGNTLASIEGARVAAYLAFHSTLRQGEKDVYIYSPSDVKLSIAGKRNANKEDMRLALSSFSLTKGVPYQEDVYDAIALVIHHMRKEGEM